MQLQPRGVTQSIDAYLRMLLFFGLFSTRCKLAKGKLGHRTHFDMVLQVKLQEGKGWGQELDKKIK